MDWIEISLSSSRTHKGLNCDKMQCQGPQVCWVVVTLTFGISLQAFEFQQQTAVCGAVHGATSWAPASPWVTWLPGTGPGGVSAMRPRLAPWWSCSLPPTGNVPFSPVPSPPGTCLDALPHRSPSNRAACSDAPWTSEAAVLSEQVTGSCWPPLSRRFCCPLQRSA